MPNKLNKTLTIVLIILLVFGLAEAGYLIYNNSANQTETITNPNEQPTIPDSPNNNRVNITTNSISREDKIAQLEELYKNYIYNPYNEDELEAKLVVSKGFIFEAIYNIDFPIGNSNARYNYQILGYLDGTQKAINFTTEDFEKLSIVIDDNGSISYGTIDDLNPGDFITIKFTYNLMSNTANYESATILVNR